ncbi:MAG TPA: phospholipase D-like domain-containing protein [Longimicrobium sp.]
MPEFLRAKSVAAEIDTIIDRAREHLVLISPYLDLTEYFWGRLQEASERGIPITVVARQDAENRGEDYRLLELPGVSVFLVERLHAKCYYNEKTLVITSLNLLKGSEQNYEMGVRFSVDEPIYADAVEEVESIKRRGVELRRHVTARLAQPAGVRVQRGRPEPSRDTGKQGSCIRCGTDVRRNADAPFCRECWNVWSAFGNPDYPERFCHDCGREADTTMNRPRCRRCFTAAVRA